MAETARRPPSPYDFLPPVPSLTVASNDFRDGDVLPDAHVADVTMGLSGERLSPSAWDDGPEGTDSYAVTCSTRTRRPAAGSGTGSCSTFPAPSPSFRAMQGAERWKGSRTGALQARNDTGQLGYVGAAPPSGHGDHRYMFAVHAVGKPSLGLDESATPAYVGFNLTFNTLARGLIVAVFGR